MTDQNPSSNTSTDEPANEIFYKVESLAFEAMSVAITAPAGTQRVRSENSANAENTDISGTPSIAARQSAVKKIRQIITDYIDEIIEEEAPHLVAQALARALAPPSSEHPSKKG